MARQTIADRYEVLETLSAAPDREEFRALDRRLGREVLLVRTQPTDQPAAKAPSLSPQREAQALARLRHPGVQVLFELCEDGGWPTLVLEPVPGTTLEERLAGSDRLTVAEVQRLGIELADALAAVHGSGAVHRDVSERNVVLRSDGSSCLTGFRLAKPVALGDRTSIDYGQGTSGSVARASLPTHPAPEQLQGEAANPRTDLFGLGCVLYRALTGCEAIPDLLDKGWRVPIDPARLAPEAPRALAKLLLSCLARSPVGRPASASELRTALAAIALPWTELASATPRRLLPRSVAWVAGALILVAGLWALRWRGEPTASERGKPIYRAAPPPTRYQPSYRQAHALLVGITYGGNGFAKLPNAVPDIRAIGERLLSLAGDRWNTRLLVDGDATKVGILRALKDLEDELEPEDRAFVYFAGHGMRKPDAETTAWVVPADGRPGEEDEIHESWISFDVLTRFMLDARAKHVLLAMDCCYGGRITRQRGEEASEYDQHLLTEPAKVMLSSGREDQPVSDGVAGEHSPFARVFLQGLARDAPAMTSGYLYSSLLDTYRAEGLKQVPSIGAPEGIPLGEFVFFLKAGP